MRSYFEIRQDGEGGGGCLISYLIFGRGAKDTKLTLIVSKLMGQLEPSSFPAPLSMVPLALRSVLSTTLKLKFKQD